MELILTGRLDRRAARPSGSGLVTRVVPAEATVEAALALAAADRRRCRRSPSPPPSAAINEAYERRSPTASPSERQAFFDLFATDDQKEGMAAFVEKRPPRWTGR